MLRSTTAGGALDDKVGHMEANNGMWTTGHSNRSLVQKTPGWGEVHLYVCYNDMWVHGIMLPHLSFGFATVIGRCIFDDTGVLGCSKRH